MKAQLYRKSPAYGLALALLSTLNAQLSTGFAQGSLMPPGAPAPTMKSLDQIEARTPISALPFTITDPGSYYLLTNLTGASNQDGITIQANNVTLDLNGYALIGGGGFPNNGIKVASTIRNLTVRNGTVRGWAQSGAETTSAGNAEFHHLRFSDNGASGLYAGADSLVADCVAEFNVDRGIRTGAGCTIIACVFNQNNGTGLVGGAGCTVKDCVARLNAAQGISVDDGSTISGCSVSTNTISGLSGGSGCVVNNCSVSYGGSPGGLPAVSFGFSSSISGCTVFRNKSTGILAGDGSTIRNCTLRENGGDGILVTNACAVVDNSCQSNGGGGTLAGIHAAGAGNRIENNNVTFNLTRGIKVDADHNLVIRNSAKDNSGMNFDITGGSYGQIYLTPGAAFTNSNPWANFSY